MYLLRCLYAKQRDVDPDVNDEEEWNKAPPYRRRRWRVICP